MTTLNWLDWLIIAVYGLLSAAIGLLHSKRASRNMQEYFLAGRVLPWWLAGTSIAATWFATDAPLAMVSLIRKEGLYANWIWWHLGAGIMMLMFFYARLWRRSLVLTNAEFIELRYSGKSASLLRAFRAVYEGLLQNGIMMGWVMLAVAKFSQVLMGWSMSFTLMVSIALVLLYTIASGLWGVVVTDLMQFTIGMSGCIFLAVVVLVKYGGPAAMAEQIAALPYIQSGTFDMLPNPNHLAPLKFISFAILISIIWLRQGDGGDGYTVQRIFAAKNEKHAVLAALWFAFAGIVILSLPWMITGLGSLITFPLDAPELHGDQEMAYPLMVVKMLPQGLRGLLVVSFLAAFMSTMSTHLCWGASYLVNDLYLRFIKPASSARATMIVSRLSVLILAVIAMLIAWQMRSIERAWYYIMQILAGTTIVSLLRWFWWRINAWAEITAILGSVVLANGNFIAMLFHKLGMLPDSAMQTVNTFWKADYDVLRALSILVLCTLLCFLVMYVTRPVSEDKLTEFYRRVRPAGWWKPVAAKNLDIHPDSSQKMPWIGWAFGTLFLNCSLIGLAHLFTGRFLSAGFLILVAVISFIVTYRIATKEFQKQTT